MASAETPQPLEYWIADLLTTQLRLVELWQCVKDGNTTTSQLAVSYKEVDELWRHFFDASVEYQSHDDFVEEEQLTFDRNRTLHPEFDLKIITLAPRKAEPAGRGEEDYGPHIRDIGRVLKNLESPPATDDCSGCCLTRRKRRVGGRSTQPGPWLSSRKAEESAGDGRLLELLLILPENARRRTADTAGTVAEFKNLS
ncbi:hypothetical protein pipiens_005823 [Culex pipiens pipiens]|uniref:Uncharacterized protein n=1 Tax=Culex pipiens pipiens TaxID=38569 RepID=A0ABD1DV69_CULPP